MDQSTMDRFVPDPMGYGPPQSSIYHPQASHSWFSNQQSSRSSSTFDRPTPKAATLDSSTRLRSVDPVRKISPPKEITLPEDIMLPEEKTPHTAEDVAKENNSPYGKALEFLGCWRNQCLPHSRRPYHVSSPWDDYNFEKPLRIDMSKADWGKLSNVLSESET
jgi:hypothetical protein